jgi:hypothetical protein
MSHLSTVAKKVIAETKQIEEIQSGFEATLAGHYGLERYQQLKEEIVRAEAAREKHLKVLKEAAREEAVRSDEITTVIENERLRVRVIPVKPKISYNAEKASSTFPDELFDEVATFSIDVAKMDAKILVGLPDDVLEKVLAAQISTPQTSMVKVEFIAPVPASQRKPLPKTGT